MSDRTQRQLKTLSNGLVVYGVIGIVLTIVLLGATATIGSRLESLSTRLTDRLETISATIDKTATTLETAGSTSGSFSSTIQQGATTIGQVNATLGEVVTAVHEIQAAASTLSILGQNPLASLSARFGTVATQLETLQSKVGELGGNLGDNQSKLSELGSRTTELATQLRLVSQVLSSGEIEDSLNEIVSVVRLALGLLAVWFAVPAIAALAFGIWIRRQLRAEGSTTATV